MLYLQLTPGQEHYQIFASSSLLSTVPRKTLSTSSCVQLLAAEVAADSIINFVVYVVGHGSHHNLALSTSPSSSLRLYIFSKFTF